MTQRLEFLILFLIVLVHCNWDQPTTIYTAQDTITYQDTFFDTSTGIAHIVFGPCRSTKLRFAYLNFDMQNQISNITFLFDTYYTDRAGISVSGKSDGKSVYSALSLKRKGFDIYFIETNDGGVTWTNLTLPRSNNLDDNLERNHPSLFYVEKVGLFLFYFRCDENFCFIAISMRKENSNTWEEEKILKKEPCGSVSNSHAFFATTVINTDGTKSILMVAGCENPWKTAVAESKDNGLNWTMNIRYNDNQYILNPAVISTEERKGLVYIGMAQQLSNNHMMGLTLYQYADKKWHEVFMLPMQWTRFMDMDCVKRDGKLQFLMFSYDILYNDNNHVKTLLINFDEPWKIEELPNPHMNLGSRYVRMKYVKGVLMAVGLDNAKSIVATRYHFGK